MSRPPSETETLAWEIHRENGHAEGYDGPCWGPTLEERREARQRIADQRKEA